MHGSQSTKSTLGKHHLFGSDERTGCHWAVCQSLVITCCNLKSCHFGSATPQQHLRGWCNRYFRVKLKLSPAKCILFQRWVKYLWHVVSEQGISPHPGKIWSYQNLTETCHKAFWNFVHTTVALSLHLLKLHILWISVSLLLHFHGPQKQRILS